MIDPDKEAEQFISLRETLELIAEARQCDPQQAAQWLARNCAPVFNKLKTYDPVKGLVDLRWDGSYYNQNSDGSGIDALDRLAREGTYHVNEDRFTSENDDDIPF
ncbi:MAG: hypothetical protein H6R07_530 [Proteobacteria bacterium]|nr:hypothetical protein [Pseudomonadota bacterium]